MTTSRPNPPQAKCSPMESLDKIEVKEKDDNLDPSRVDTSISDQSLAPEPKRRKKSRWDSAPDAKQTETPPMPPISSPPLPPQPYPQATDQHKTQQMIALQALNLSLSSYANFQPPPPPTPPPPPLPMMPQAPNVKDCRIYVGSLHYELKEAEIKMLFSSFGTIRTIDMSLEPGTGRSKGFCFIEYDTPAGAEAAQAMNNFELAGRNIKVGRPHSTCGGPAPPSVSLAPTPVLLPGMTAKQQAQVLLNPPPTAISFVY